MKKKKGFTLIELLAVIVILAIIALIATPVIMNIINSSRENSAVESANLYIKALRTVSTKKMLDDQDYKLTTCTEPTCGGLTIVTEETMPEAVNLTFVSGKLQEGSTMKVSNVCLKYTNSKWTSTKCGEVCYGYKIILSDYKINHDICMEAFEDEAICRGEGTKDDPETIPWYMDQGYEKALEEEGIVDLIYETTDECIAPKIFNRATSDSVTKGNVPTGNFNAGDEYLISVDKSKLYHFAVLSTDSTKVNLIMLDEFEEFEWATKEDYADNTNWGSNGNPNKGPITAMTKLHELTKNWNTISNIKLNYTDENINRVKIAGSCQTFQMGATTMEYDCDYNFNVGDHTSGYKGIFTDDTGKTVIKDFSGNVVREYTNLKARLPYVSELIQVGCGAKDDTCPSWLDFDAWTLASESSKSGVGYSAIEISNRKLDVGLLNSHNYDEIRPVITLNKSDLEG